MKTRRNAPRPCGSGIKYKPCCLQTQQSQQIEDFLWQQKCRAIKGLSKKLLRLSQNHWIPRALPETREDFTLCNKEEFSPDTPHMQDESENAPTRHRREKIEALLRDFELRNANSNLLLGPSILDELYERLGLKKF